MGDTAVNAFNSMSFSKSAKVSPSLEWNLEILPAIIHANPVKLLYPTQLHLIARLIKKSRLHEAT
jgi:hypothetical protein